MIHSKVEFSSLGRFKFDSKYNIDSEINSGYY